MIERIPLVKVAGSHFACGVQLGNIYKENILSSIDEYRNFPPEHQTWNDCLQQTPEYLRVTNEVFPFVVEEIMGAAQGAGVNFMELFATGIEEFYAKPNYLKACTDIVAISSEHTIVGHNNDLSPKAIDLLSAVEWSFCDGSRMFTVGLSGVFVSVGANDAPLLLTGNEMTQNDIRFGIPRTCIARAILSARSFDEAVRIANHPNRASSYNNIITTMGRSVDVEGSATDYELIYPVDGVLAHANHYVAPKMLSYEAEPNYASSIRRHERAEELARGVSNVTAKTMKRFLSDHGKNGIHGNETVCRHGDKSITVFGVVADMENGVVELATGFPCQNQFEEVWRFGK